VAIIDIKRTTLRVKDGTKTGWYQAGGTGTGTGSAVPGSGANQTSATGNLKWTTNITSPDLYGTIKNGSGYAAGYAAHTTGIVVDGLHVVGSYIPVGSVLAFLDYPNEHYLIKSVSGAIDANKTIILDRALDRAIADNDQFFIVSTTKSSNADYVGAGNEIEVNIGEGTLEYTETRTIEYVLNRGVLDEVKEGDEVPLEVNIDFIWEYIKGAGSTPSIEEALKNEGLASTWISTDPDGCRPYAVDIEIDYRPTPTTCGDAEIIILPDFRWESISHGLVDGSINVTGKCNVTKALAVRFAQS
jgi:hypothetical protein